MSVLLSPKIKKRIGAALGYTLKWTSYHNEKVYYEVETEWTTETIEFAPESNAAQYLVCEEAFVLRIEIVNVPAGKWKVLTQHSEVFGPTIRETVLAAIKEMFDEV